MEVWYYFARKMYERGEITRREFLQIAATGAVCGLLPDIEIKQEIKAPVDTILQGNEDMFGSDIILTIDDCASREYTRGIFETIRSVGGTATFFPNTDYITKGEEDSLLWKEILASGCEIGYHTRHHNKDLSARELAQDYKDFCLEINKLVETDVSIRLARAPYGNWTTDWMKFTEKQGLINVLWNFVPNIDQVTLNYFDAVLHSNKGGHIVLVHPRAFDDTWVSTHIQGLAELAARDGGALRSVLADHTQQNSG